MQLKSLLLITGLFISNVVYSDVATTKEKIEYAKQALVDVLEERELMLDANSVSIRTSFSPLQVVLQTATIIAQALPLGEADSDLEVVRFEAENSLGNILEGWIHLFSTTANGCQNECSHQLNYPTAMKTVSRNSGEIIFFRLYNSSLPESTFEMNLHLSPLKE